MTAGADDLWVFAYGSLMWRPGFVPLAAVPASIDGYHRAFCVLSFHYRGTPGRPGLVLGLDRGGVCRGLAYRIAAEDRAAVLAYLRARELIYGVYRERHLEARLMTEGRERVTVLAYVAERAHPSYAGRLPLRTAAAVIRRARGSMGTNVAYLASTLAHLDEMAICEPRLHRLLVAAGMFAVRGKGEARARSVAEVWARRPIGALRVPQEPKLARFKWRAPRSQ